METENSKERQKQKAGQCALNETRKALGIKVCVYVWRGAVIKVERLKEESCLFFKVTLLQPHCLSLLSVYWSL